MTSEDVDKFREVMFARGPSMARSGLVCLNTLVNDALNRGKMVRSEVHALDVPKGKPRERRLDEWETCRLIEAVSDLGGPRADVFEILLRLAKRKEEVAEMPWEELDLPNRLWKLPAERNKSKKPHLILLPRQVCEIIERQQPDRAKRSGPVFTLNGSTPIEMGSQVKDVLDANMQRRAELADERDGSAKRIAHFTIHDWRKVGSSRLKEAPFMYSRDLINSMLLHTNGDQLDDIYILTQMVQETGDMVQVWNDHVDVLLAGVDLWPGGRVLEKMKPSERIARLAKLRVGWPKRADQIRAEAEREAGPAKKKRRK